MALEDLILKLSDSVNRLAAAQEIANGLAKRAIDLRSAELDWLQQQPKAQATPPATAPAVSSGEKAESQPKTTAKLNKRKPRKAAAETPELPVAPATPSPDPAANIPTATITPPPPPKKDALERLTEDDLARVNSAIGSYLAVVNYDKSKVAAAVKSFGYKKLEDIPHDCCTRFLDHIAELRADAQEAAREAAQAEASADEGWE